ncbi:hypothetical protein [Lichenicola sp.]|uniref:hypothetical protein n=1 Tax=Lichenicola sp. TaxID=2804529 RepID=UPI003AFF7ABA
MTTLSFDNGYAMFQSDTALFGRREAGTPVILRQLSAIVATPQVEAASALVGRTVLALVPFSALVWMFVAR